jgi:hypothetical protein
MHLVQHLIILLHIRLECLLVKVNIAWPLRPPPIPRAWARKEDVWITLAENAREDWSFGGGEMQDAPK